MTAGPAAFGGARVSPPEHLSSDHDVTTFDCGKPDLNRWLHERARSSEGKTARTLVVSADRRVVAYYCLAVGAVVRSELPKKIQRNTPDRIPVVVIGRLAVDAGYHGCGLGKALLRDAILRVLTASEDVGVRAVIVHAIDDEAASFYRKYGFQPSPANARTLILPMETARLALG